MHADVVIVGAGHGGAQAAISLRANNFSGSIIMVGRERELPYERPPLSKDYLSRGKIFERLHIRPGQFWQDKNVELRLSCEVTKIDPISKTVQLSDGSSVCYGNLIWSAGGDPRKLNCPGSDLEGVHYVRTRADVDGLMGDLDDGAHDVVVVGGGYIGLESSAVLTKLGRKVALVETLPRILARVAGEEIAAFFEAEHRGHGVDLRTNAVIDSLVGTDGRVTGVKLADGSVLPAQIVIVGIGIVPCVEPLMAAGAECENGVLVDEFCRTSLPEIYAIGDCAAFACGFAGGKVLRVESVQNANDMATCVARVICGTPERYHSVPWFWSNQYDLRLQTAGLSLAHDKTVLRGKPSQRSFTVCYLRNGQLIALDCVNMVKDYVQGRKLVEQGLSPDLDQLADPTVELRDLAS